MIIVAVLAFVGTGLAIGLVLYTGWVIAHDHRQEVSRTEFEAMQRHFKRGQKNEN